MVVQNGKQPIRRIPGQAYGEGKALVEQQQTAPLPAQQQVSIPNVFAPTERPAEPITEGAMLGGSPHLCKLLMKMRTCY